MPPIIIMETSVYDTKPYDRRYLERALGSERIQWRFHEFRLNAETAITAQGSKAVSVFVNDRADRACLEQLSRAGVQLLALRCAGFNNVDVSAARELKMAVTRVPAYSPHAVAEHAIALLLTLNRKIHRAYNRVRELNFSLNGLEGAEIFGKTVGIIGTGRIGKIAAQIFRGFEATVLAYDPMPTPGWAAKAGVAYVSLSELIRASDVISLHLPLVRETEHLLNGGNLALMKPGAMLINTSRGKLIDTAALVAALKSGRLGGVALDVYEEEEGIFFEDLSGRVLQDDVLSRLLTFPNVLITSHQGFLTHEALSEIARVTVQNILKLETGEPYLADTAV
jgi:D-lactate dehydrogenase